MRAYELHPNDGLDALQGVERPSRPLQPGEARLRVRAVSLNYRDLIVARGTKSAKRPRPIVPASDGAGELIELGPGTSSPFAVGERVAANFFPSWIEGPLSDAHHAAALGGGNNDGMLAEEVIVPAASLVRVPAGLSFEEAATLPCAGVTAWHALFVGGRVGPGDTVLVQGTGGVSLFALQLARAAGARVIATSSSAEKRARAEALGAWKTIDYKANPDWGKAALALTEGRGVDLVVDVGGPATFDQSVLAARYGGTVSILGVLTGTSGEVNLYRVFHKNLHVSGVYVGSRRMFEALNQAIEVNGTRPVIDRVFPFEEARGAYEHLASGAHFGKVVISLR